ncbi:MAG: T9SS type A sorting domain-containing protein [Bacteroidota bacterium]
MSPLGASAQDAVLYVSPSGDDAHPGTLEQPMQSVAAAFNRAEAGRQIRLLPGRYLGINRLRLNQGAPERPIVIRGHSTHPDSLAIIDGQGQPGLEQSNACFLLAGVHWVVIQDLSFRNCWTDAINIAGSSYITIAGNDFLGSRRAVQPTSGTHHVLVEHNTFEQDERVWTTWAWDDLHHGEREPLGHFNGALLHPKESDGGHVMRGNLVKNVFNGFRTRPERLNEDANIEVYDNTFVNVRDNALEPEGYVWNHHYFRNRLYNSRKSFSIDEVEGGGVYIWGNVQWQEARPTLGPSTRGGGAQSISGLWKFHESARLDTVWIFNNSFFTKARVFKDLRRPFSNIYHVNNAYAFFDGGGWGLDHWEPSYTFDHDCANLQPASVLRNNGASLHSVTTDDLFTDPLEGDLRLTPQSPCRDAGTVLSLPAFGWTQSFSGAAPDIGSFEDTTWVEGPPFRYQEPPGGDGFDERPRITRHRAEADRLTLHFSAPLDVATVSAAAVQVFVDAAPVPVIAATLRSDGYTLDLATAAPLSEARLTLAMDPLPLGTNGQPATHWASTVPYALGLSTTRPTAARSTIPPPQPPRLSLYPNPSTGPTSLAFTMERAGPIQINLYDLTGRRLYTATRTLAPGRHIYRLEVATLPAGLYLLRLRTPARSTTQTLTVVR